MNENELPDIRPVLDLIRSIHELVNDRRAIIIQGVTAFSVVDRWINDLPQEWLNLINKYDSDDEACKDSEELNEKLHAAVAVQEMFDNYDSECISNHCKHCEHWRSFNFKDICQLTSEYDTCYDFKYKSDSAYSVSDNILKDIDPESTQPISQKTIYPILKFFIDSIQNEIS